MLKFTVYGQNVACDYDLAASDSIDYLEAVFIFSRDWDDLDKVAQFTDDNTTYNVSLSNDRCVIPAELGFGSVLVSVFGQEPGGTKRITTISCPINIKQSGYVAQGTDTIPPTPDLYSQLLGKIQDAVDSIPTNLSEFINDTGYITDDAVPKNVSELANDAGYITDDAVPKNVSELSNDAGYITDDAVPEKISELANDTGYITDESVPKKISELANDMGYITVSDIPESGTDGEYDTVINTRSEWNEMIASSDWNGARNVLVNCDISICGDYENEEWNIVTVPENVKKINMNHHAINIEQYGELKALGKCRLENANNLYGDLFGYITDFDGIIGCSFCFDRGAHIQNCKNIVDCDIVSFEETSSIKNCDTILLTSENMAKVSDRLVNCTNIITSKDYVDSLVGDISAALAEISAIQAKYSDAGGDAV